MRDVNPKNLARLENNMNNKSALVKHLLYIHKIIIWIGITQKILAKETDYTRRFLESFFIHSNNNAFHNKTICFYPTAYHNLKFLNTVEFA